MKAQLEWSSGTDKICPAFALTPNIAPNDYGESIENKVVVIRAERLRLNTAPPTGSLCWPWALGAHADARGRAVYTVNLYSGKEVRWNREDILGVLKPEYMPDWAQEQLKQILAGQQAKHKKQVQER